MIGLTAGLLPSQSGMAAASGEAISLACAIAPGVDSTRGEAICRELAEALGAAYPDRTFLPDSKSDPAIEVTVTGATDSFVGLDLAWRSANGDRSTGRPMQLSVSDRTTDPGMRRGFYLRFLALNPLPF